MTEIEFNYCTALQGGAAGALDAIPLADCGDGEVAFVFISASRLFIPMVFDILSAEAEAVPDGSGKIVIKPDDAGASAGRWESYIIWHNEVDHDVLKNFTQDEHKTISQTRTDTGPLVIETRTDDDPTTPARIWYREDL